MYCTVYKVAFTYVIRRLTALKFPTLLPGTEETLPPIR